MLTMTETEYTAQPYADIKLEDAGDALDAILTNLEENGQVHGPVVGYDQERGRIDAIFQVYCDTEVEADANAAARLALLTFARALSAAGITASAVGVAVVEGGDPDLLP